jgi:hypothetical protein
VRTALFLLLCLAPLTRGLAGDRVSSQEVFIPLVEVDLAPALTRDAQGYPRVDRAKVDLNKVVTIPRRAVILENQFLKLTLLPEMGRVYSSYSKLTGHELFWTNAIARPIFNQHNDLGWWMVRGGVEYTIPRGEHGTTWALPWSYSIHHRVSGSKAVRMRVLEPATRLLQEVEISLAPNEALFEAAISVRNTGDAPVHFAHWMNPMWAPGGRGELTARTEFIVPCGAMLVADKPFNQWMHGLQIEAWQESPLRFFEDWKSLGDLLATNLTAGFYSAFCHEADEGIVRVFDPKITPGVDIWTWGYNPPDGLQKQYSLVPNRGYVEMWGGTGHDFSEGSQSSLNPEQKVAWKEYMYGYHGTGGLIFANRMAAMNVTYLGPNISKLRIFAARALRPGELNLLANGRSIWKNKADLKCGAIVETEIPVGTRRDFRLR